MKLLNGVDGKSDWMIFGSGRTLKYHRVVAINMALTNIFVMRLDCQNAKECIGSSHQSHGFNPSHIDLHIKDSCGQEKKEIYSKDRFKDKENL